MAVNRRVSKKTVFLVILFSIFLIIIYTIFEFTRIKKNFEKEHKLHFKPVNKPIHVPLFVNPAQVSHQTRFLFTFDSPEILKSYREKEHLDQAVEGYRSDFELALKLMKWSRSQWEPGRPEPYPPINALEILRQIRLKQTGGFCAQYNYIFVQGLQSFGIPARYVTIQHHEVTEAWIKKYEKWICFDPLFNCHYADRNGFPLSVSEISQDVKRKNQVQVIGNPYLKNRISHLDQFRQFAVWIKNNHVSSPINFSDLEYYKVYFIESPGQRTRIPIQALHTSNLQDLYFNPEEQFPPPL